MAKSPGAEAPKKPPTPAAQLERRSSSPGRAPSCFPASLGWRPACSHPSPTGDSLNGDQFRARRDRCEPASTDRPYPQTAVAQGRSRRDRRARPCIDATRGRRRASGHQPSGGALLVRSKDELLAEALTVDEERFYVEMRERMDLLERPRDQLRFMIEASAEEYDWTLWIELWARALRDPRPTDPSATGLSLARGDRGRDPSRSGRGGVQRRRCRRGGSAAQLAP